MIKQANGKTLVNNKTLVKYFILFSCFIN